MKINYSLFHSYFTRFFVFWFLIIAFGSIYAQVEIGNSSIADSVVYQEHKVAQNEIPTFYITGGAFVYNDELINTNIIIIPHKPSNADINSVKPQQKIIKKDNLTVEKKKIKYTEPIIENRIVFDTDNQSTDRFSNNTVSLKNLVLPQNVHGKLKSVLTKNTLCFIIGVPYTYTQSFFKIIFTDALFSKKNFTRPPPDFFYLINYI